MITVVRLRGEKTIGFHASGHSGSAAHGMDIICAAVSALTQTAHLALSHFDIGFSTHRNDDAGILCIIAQDCEQSRIILTSMYCGLEAIAEQYPQYVRLLPFQEVEA